MSFSDTQSAKKYAAIAEVAASQAKIYAQELQDAPSYAAEAAASAEAAATSSSSASQYAGNAAEAATSASSSASAAASSAASAASAAQSAISQTVRAPQGETLSQLPAAASRQNQYIATDSAGNVTIVPRGSIPVLDSNGKLPVSTIPAIALTQPFVVSSQAAMLSLDAQPGDIAKRTDLGYSFCLAASPASTLSNWIQLTDDVLAQLGLSSGATQVGATSLTGASSTVQAELSKKPNSANLAASNGAAAIGALDDSSSATTVQGALNLKMSIANLLGTGAGQGANGLKMIQPFTGAVGRLQSDFNQQLVSVRDFVLSTDTTHDSAFSKAAIACISNNVGLRIPSGDYSLTQDWVINLITGKNLLILGDGSGVTRLFFRGSANGISISAGGSQEWNAGSVHVRGISIITSNVNSGVALNINQNQLTGIPAGSVVCEDLQILGENTHTQQWATGMIINRTSGSVIRDVDIYGYAQSVVGDGISFLGTADDVSTQHVMDNVRFFFLNRSVIANEFIQGLFFNCVNVFNANYGLVWNASAEANGQTELHIVNSQMTFQTCALNLTRIGFITINSTMFIGNRPAGASYTLIVMRLDGCFDYSITNNNIFGASSTSTIGIEINNQSGAILTYQGVLSSNIFDSLDIGVLIDAGAGGGRMYDNVYSPSVNNQVVNNSGLNLAREDAVFKFAGTTTFGTSNALQRVTVAVPAGLFKTTPELATIHWNGDYVIFGNYQVSESSATSLVFTVRRYDGSAFNGGPFSYSVRASQ
ncbi:MAG: hypothetical protein E7L09_05495 [Enterobacteriaceae bacterium]|nr:hypothetical protein [Enterobacteriaceae bacterium]